MVCAGSLDWPAFVRLANPDAYIARIDEGGELDLEVKIEWGRGFWMADDKGLHRIEEGADSTCMKRRQIKEVDEEGFYPNSAVFGGCRMIRLTVHKLMGQRWCLSSQTCPDPMEQLVVEIWTDTSTSPRAILEFGLHEVIAWLIELKRQVSHDTDFDREDEELRDTWEKIDKYQALEHRQGLMGGPPVVPLHKTSLFPGLKESDCQYADSTDVSQYPQAPFSLPRDSPKPPKEDTLEWLAKELQQEEYSDPSTITAENFKQFISEPVPDTFENKDIEQLPVDKEIIETLRMVCFII
ncbi:bifunctional DNA-directed RNA polymerase [Babesia duncani]|uniref:Bifunctional DNA-directed RNA polymerase n=1 Tax=Babesia duncani TaxID=323732 RepID=A0AAD9PLP8_9APIC|nr:bifunctional DNA-directed RNA polymerase [Babesia duncani]